MRVTDRAGTSVRILCVDGQGTEPVIGIHCDTAETWTADGRYWSDEERASHLDLQFADDEPQSPIPALVEALEEILGYSGGAENALEDEYVMERARAALALARKAVKA